MRTLWTAEQSAGSLLVASFLVLSAAVVILFASGAATVFSSVVQGSLEQMAPYAPAFRLLNLLWTVGWMVQLLGFGLLTYVLLRAGKEYLAIPAFLAVLIAVILGVLHGTFHMAIETWAAGEAVRTGNVPVAYELLARWVGSAFRVGYVTHLVATAGFGWGILRTRILAPWMGPAAIGWSVLWLAGYGVGGGAPGILFIMPAVIGVALLWQKEVDIHETGEERE